MQHTTWTSFELNRRIVCRHVDINNCKWNHWIKKFNDVECHVKSLLVTTHGMRPNCDNNDELHFEESYVSIMKKTMPRYSTLDTQISFLFEIHNIELKNMNKQLTWNKTWNQSMKRILIVFVFAIVKCQLLKWNEPYTCGRKIN